MPKGTPANIRYHIVARSTSSELINETLKYIDPDSQGDALTLWLRRITDIEGPNTAAVAGSWAMDDFTSFALREAFRVAGWTPRPLLAERTVRADLDSVPSFDGSNLRMWLFDGEILDFDSCIESIGLARPYIEDYY